MMWVVYNQLSHQESRPTLEHPAGQLDLLVLQQMVAYKAAAWLLPRIVPCRHPTVMALDQQLRLVQVLPLAGAVRLCLNQEYAYLRLVQVLRVLRVALQDPVAPPAPELPQSVRIFLEENLRGHRSPYPSYPIPKSKNSLNHVSGKTSRPRS